MLRTLKKYMYGFVFSLFLLVGCVLPSFNMVEAKPPTFEQTKKSRFLGKIFYDIDGVKKDNLLKDNIVYLFYPGGDGDKQNRIFDVIKTLTIAVMIIYIVIAGASLLFNKKPEDIKKGLINIGLVVLGGVFVYGANRLFSKVLSFDDAAFGDGGSQVKAVTEFVENDVFKSILAFVKAAAFFYAIIMIVITGFKIVQEGDGEKSRKLIKGLINVIAALMIIKGVDVLYQMAYDSGEFVEKASLFIKNAAKFFAYVYGIVVMVMVFASGYLYLTDGGSGNGFKKASNILVNIILSGVVLFGFLLIVYQILAEFSTGGDAVTMVYGSIVNDINMLGNAG